mmetsp:Transcript_34802/g.45807  ORF Transcript_34802/g.45807 Transcript_34802/m.45807 type:complete len:109 (+) Transcript_34802:2-328(+)
MKKGLLLIIAAGTLLVSCGGGQEKEAAKELCGCYEGVLDAQDKAGNAGNTEDLFSAQSAMVEEAKKGMDCLISWRDKYDGKVDIEKVKEEVKAENKKVFDLLTEQGVF